MKNTKMTAAQKWEAATFADNFIFCRVMTEYPDICRELLEIGALRHGEQGARL